jgi:hypothetical protein
MHLRIGLCAAALAFVLTSDAARAIPSGAVAIVLKIDGPQNSAVYLMEYLKAGETFQQNQLTRLTIGYFQSCIEERVTGGFVQIGTERSTVRERGSRSFDKVKCDSAQQGVISVYGLSPLIRVLGPKIVRVRHVGSTAPPLELHVPPGVPFYDMAEHGQTLEAGGLYEFSTGYRKVEVRVDPSAQEKHVPMLSRFVDL